MVHKQQFLELLERKLEKYPLWLRDQLRSEIIKDLETMTLGEFLRG